MVTRSSLSNSDLFTGLPVSMTADHKYIHNGIGFSTVITTTSISTGGNYGIAFIAPANGYVHLRPVFASTLASPIKITISEAPTYTGGSTNANGIRNRNRNSSRQSGATVLAGTTQTGIGTVMDIFQVGYGGNPSNSGGGTSDGSTLEWVLKPGAKYGIYVENVGSTVATTATVGLFWYEESLG